jgi:hypothetical protein
MQSMKIMHIIIPPACWPVVLIVDIMRDILEVLHVGLYEEPPEVREVAVLPVLNVHEAPGILAASYRLPTNLKYIYGHLCLWLWNGPSSLKYGRQGVATPVCQTSGLVVITRKNFKQKQKWITRKK